MWIKGPPKFYHILNQKSHFQSHTTLKLNKLSKKMKQFFKNVFEMNGEKAKIPKVK